jgi:hypothetical protein
VFAENGGMELWGKSPTYLKEKSFLLVGVERKWRFFYTYSHTSPGRHWEYSEPGA